MIRKSLVLAFACFALIATTAASCPSGVAETPQQRVFALKTEYAALLQVAVGYESLPRCPETTASACSDPKIVETMRKVDTNVVQALDAAETAVRSGAFDDGGVLDSIIASARAAVTSFQDVLKKL